MVCGHFAGGKEAGREEHSHRVLVYERGERERTGPDECPDRQGRAGPCSHGGGAHQALQGCQHACSRSAVHGPGLLPQQWPA